VTDFADAAVPLYLRKSVAFPENLDLGIATMPLSKRSAA